MMSLRKRLLLTFLPLGVIPIALVSMSLWLVMSANSAQHIQQLSEVINQQIRKSNQEDFFLMDELFSGLVQKIDQHLTFLSNREDLQTYLEKSQPDPIATVLFGFVQSADLDFVTVFDLQGDILASSPPNIDHIEAAKRFKHTLLHNKIRREIEHLDRNHRHLLGGFTQIGPGYAELAEQEPSSDLSYGPVLAKVVVDPFGDPLGYVVAGMQINHLHPSLMKMVRLTRLSFVSYIDGRPHMTAGFKAQPGPLQPAEQQRIIHTGSGALMQSLDGEEHLLECRPFDDYSHNLIAIHCVGIALTQAQETIAQMRDSGDDALHTMQFVLVLIAVISMAVVALVSVVLSQRIVRPIQAMTYALARLSDDDLDAPIPHTHNTQEINRLAETMRVFKARMVERREALEEKNQEVTRRMALEQSLAHTRKLEALGTLAGGVAHELNNQLLPIMSMTELVRDDLAPDDPNRRLLQLVFDSSVGAKSTVSKILAFSRFDQEHVGQCDVAQACLVTVEFLRAACPNNVQMQFEIPDFIGFAPMNQDDLQGVLANLFSNALDAMQETSGRFRITLSSQTVNQAIGPAQLQSGEYALIRVSDNGSGMDEITRQRLFDPFYTTKAPGKGVGLGMSIVHSAISQAGGTISVESKIGEGSTFRIYLPIVEQTRQTTDNE
ncbi:sensor histidine kinase [Magnetofaba australis]|uniref:histidine kinase n=1 Tax=Magnetofaba australis IT-1 TaxID=1434232 RepID=A0A1Y2K2K7_9PROT|nr:ATP-binding protein [Magnetofaba australis]OSM02243.1 hypothetical protein MAIT1_02353 [Magnetofaba australis IT-1]